jgi:hypothetical protein
MNSIIDAELVQAYTGLQKRAEDQRKKEFKPLTYDDIKDDPYYYHSPEPEVNDD